MSAKAYGDRLLIEDMTFKLPPGGIVGVIGPNGAGKTTLFRMITRQEQPDSGTIQDWGDCEVAYVDQSSHARSQKINLGRDFRRHGYFEAGHSRSELASLRRHDLIFPGSDQQKKVGMLSGGERNRVHLAKMLKEGRERPAAGRADKRS